MRKRTHAEGTVRSFAATLTRWRVITIGILLCLGVFGVQTTSIAAVLGGAGVGIAVALKGNLANLASGLVLVAFRPFKAGDLIALKNSDVSGRITSVGLMFTELDTLDNSRIVLPNQLLFEQPLINHEHHPERRVDVRTGVAYGTDLDRADRVLRDLVADLDWTMSGREPVVWWTGFGASSIDVKVGVWCEAHDYFKARNRLIMAIKKAFDDADIEIPFPQRDLHVRSGLSESVHESLAAK